MHIIKFLSLIIIYIVLTSYYPGRVIASSEIIEFENQEYEYGSYLYDIEQYDESKINLSMGVSDYPPVNFTYTIYTSAEVISVIGGLVTYNESSRLMVNGSIFPGQDLTITQRILKCQIDQIPGIIFEFKKSNDIQIALNLTIEVIPKNAHNCGGQLNSPEFGFPLYWVVVLLILMVIFVIFVRRFNRKFKDIYSKE